MQITRDPRLKAYYIELIILLYGMAGIALSLVVTTWILEIMVIAGEPVNYWDHSFSAELARSIWELIPLWMITHMLGLSIYISVCAFYKKYPFIHRPIKDIYLKSQDKGSGND